MRLLKYHFLVNYEGLSDGDSNFVASLHCFWNLSSVRELEENLYARVLDVALY